MPKNEPTTVTTTRIVTRGQIITAVVSLIGILIVGYWQYGSRANQPSQPKEIQYIGRVSDASTLAPVSGAKITLDLYGLPKTAYTDSEGIYLFRIIIDSESIGQIRIDAQGFPPVSNTISIRPDDDSIHEIRISPLSSMPTQEQATALPVTPTFAPTTTPAAINTTSAQAVEQQLVELIDGYYSCLNGANPNNNSDYEKCWNLLSDYPDEFQSHLNKNDFIKFWKQYKVGYVLYFCSRDSEKLVDAEYYLYEQEDLSAPIGNGQKYILEYSFALDSNGWRIKSGKVLNEKIGAYCEEFPRIERLSLFP
jgi:hypothetical protein